VPLIPDVPGLRFQAVHAGDLADAFRLAIHAPVSGAFNIAAEPVIDMHVLAGLLSARTVPVPRRATRAALSALWRLHLVPVPPELFDAALHLPLMDTTRARTELGWSPNRSAIDAIQELLTGLRQRAGAETAPLEPSSVRGRLHELRTGVGRRP
jgi:nucleoside-diphosphate-sugar epimerase